MSLRPWPCVHADLCSFVWRAARSGLETSLRNMEEPYKDYCFSLRYSNKSVYSPSSYSSIIQVSSCSLAQGPGLFCNNNNNNKKAGRLITCQKLRHFTSGMCKELLIGMVAVVWEQQQILLNEQNSDPVLSRYGVEWIKCHMFLNLSKKGIK